MRWQKVRKKLYSNLYAQRGRYAGATMPEAETKLYIHPDECIDCGACVPACPVEAIFANDEVPDKWSEYIDIDAKWFEGK